MTKVSVALEVGRTRVFAVALDWPGWTRGAKTADAAIAALVEYAARYGSAMKGFKVPRSPQVEVVEQLTGSSTTDFGAPGAIPEFDKAPFKASDVDRSLRLMECGWAAFDSAVNSASGRTLATGPRGGGRDIPKMIDHVMEADCSYLRALGGKPPSPCDSQDALWPLIKETLASAARGEIAERGPRGGQRWPARYFVRRSIWHVLDHAWEIEDRLDA